MGVAETIGPAGGQVGLSTIRLVLPTGSLDRDISIVVQRSAPDGQPVVGDVANLTPSDVTLSVPATVSIALDASLPVPTSRVALGVLVADAWRPITGSQVDASQWVSAQVVQLTTYAPVITCGNNDECATGRCDAGVCQL